MQADELVLAVFMDGNIVSVVDVFTALAQLPDTTHQLLRRRLAHQGINYILGDGEAGPYEVYSDQHPAHTVQSRKS